MARLPAGVAAIGSWASTIRITAESSVSGNQSLANSKAQPPGSSSGFRIDQSPGRKIWFATSHSAARASIGCAGSMPDSSSAFMASAVSQVGETHGWYMSVPSHTTRKSSTPWMQLTIAGCSGAKPTACSASTECSMAGWMPPHCPFLSWWRTSHSIARAMARRRKGFHGLCPTSLIARSSARKKFFVVTSSRERGKASSARVGVFSQSSFSAASGGVAMRGRCAASSASGTTVPRAQLDMA